MPREDVATIVRTSPAESFAANPAWPSLAVVLEGGHGEVFMASFTALPLAPTAPLASLKPAAARAALGNLPAIGNGLHWLAKIDPTIIPEETLPSAADAILLPPELTALPPVPIYGRGPDAKPKLQ